MYARFRADLSTNSAFKLYVLQQVHVDIRAAVWSQLLTLQQIDLGLGTRAAKWYEAKKGSGTLISFLLSLVVDYHSGAGA